MKFAAALMLMISLNAFAEAKSEGRPLEVPDFSKLSEKDKSGKVTVTTITTCNDGGPSNGAIVGSACSVTPKNAQPTDGAPSALSVPRNYDPTAAGNTTTTTVNFGN